MKEINDGTLGFVKDSFDEAIMVNTIVYQYYDWKSMSGSLPRNWFKG